MALLTEAVTHNAKVDELILTYGAMIAAAADASELCYVFADVQKGVTAATAPTFTAGQRQYNRIMRAGTEAADNIWAIPGWHVAKALGFTPLFFKVTNKAGDWA